MKIAEDKQYLEGFQWAVPTSFADAIGACQFSRGDTLYSSPSAYRPWDAVFYNTVKDLRCVMVSLPEDKPGVPSADLFESNWEIPAQVNCFTVGERIAPTSIATTQGRIYTLLWRGGDVSILDLQSDAPMVPKSARHVLKVLTDKHAPEAQHMRASIKDVVVKQHRDATHYFVLPYDLCNELLRTKYETLVRGLNGVANMRVFSMMPEDLSYPDAFNTAPTVDLKVFVFASNETDATSEVIQASLKKILYTAPAKTEGKSQKFRIEAHGWFAVVR